jgi:hypothetical protein
VVVGGCMFKVYFLSFRDEAVFVFAVYLFEALPLFEEFALGKCKGRNL